MLEGGETRSQELGCLVLTSRGRGVCWDLGRPVHPVSPAQQTRARGLSTVLAPGPEGLEAPHRCPETLFVIWSRLGLAPYLS